MDDKGYVPLLAESDLRFVADMSFIGRKKMGVDPSGEGDDKSAWVGRDRFKAKVLAEEQISTSKTIAAKTLTLDTDLGGLQPNDISVDNFGEGANVGMEIAIARPGFRVRGVNVGKQAKNPKKFANLRAELYWAVRDWCRAGGELVGTIDDWKELLTIRYRRTLDDRIEIMPKAMMRKEGIRSPNRADALSLTFDDPDEDSIEYQQEEPEPQTIYGG